MFNQWSLNDLEEKGKNLSFLVGQIHDGFLKLKDLISSEDYASMTNAIKTIDDMFSKEMNRLDVRKLELKPVLPPGAIPKVQKQSEIKDIFDDFPSSPTGSLDSQRPMTQHHNTPNQSNDRDRILMNSILSEIRSEFSRILSEQSQLTSTQVNIPLAPIPEEIISAPRKNQQGNDLPITELRFDKVTLSTFSRDHTEWISFRDEFTKYVHCNPNLSAVMKFHQLRTHLEGIALEAINGLTLSDADYEAAWSLLKGRYDNERILVAEYLKRFFDLPYLSQNPTPTQFLQMVNKTNQLIRVLPLYDYDVSSWDPILIFVLTSRLDTQTLRKWNDQIKKRQRMKELQLALNQNELTQVQKIQNQN